MLLLALRSGHYVVTDNFGLGERGGRGGCRLADVRVLHPNISARESPASGDTTTRTTVADIGGPYALARLRGHPDKSTSRSVRSDPPATRDFQDGPVHERGNSNDRAVDGVLRRHRALFWPTLKICDGGVRLAAMPQYSGVNVSSFTAARRSWGRARRARPRS
jgi:hypothetical protein